MAHQQGRSACSPFPRKASKHAACSVPDVPCLILKDYQKMDTWTSKSRITFDL